MNKYKNMSNKKLNIRDGEVALTYGVAYLDENEKNKKIKPARPFLMLKKMDDIYYSLKLKTHNTKLLGDYKIDADNYPSNDALVKDSFVNTGCVYELEKGDFIRNGVVLNKKDINNVYNRVIKQYCVEKLEIPDRLLDFLYTEYRKNKLITPGSIVKSTFFEGHFLILEEDDNYYICLPIYRDGEREYDEMIRFYKYNNFVNYAETYHLPKEGIIYISNFGINQSLFQYIKSRVEETHKEGKNRLLLNKDLSE